MTHSLRAGGTIDRPRCVFHPTEGEGQYGSYRRETYKVNQL